jgi:hypothetical protein
MSHIVVHIVVPRYGIVPLRVRRSDAIGSLAGRVKDAAADFVFRGQILDRRSTFDDCGVTDNDSIVILHGEQNRARWVRVTAEDDQFQEMVQFAASSAGRSEFLRVRDIHRMRIESNPTRYRRYIRGILAGNKDPADIFAPETVVPEPAAELCSDPLPQLW